MGLLRNILRETVLRRFRAPRDVARWAFGRYGQRQALRTAEGESLSFDELGRRVRALAAGMLAEGLAPGDRVAFTLPNSPEFVEVRLACHEAGLVAVPLIWDLSAEARGRALAAAEAGLYIFDPELDPDPAAGAGRLLPVPAGDRSALDGLARPGSDFCDVSIDPAAPATINFTSGTTGEPKGVVSTHAAWAQSLKMTARSSLLALAERELFLHAVPFATAGWGAVLPCLLGGITGLLMRRFDPAPALDLAERERVTRTFLTPSQIIDWLDDPSLDSRDLSSLRAVIYGTAPLHGPKAAEALRRLGPVLQQGYGLAEVLPPLAVLPPADHDPENFPFRAGRPARGVQVRIVDADGRRLPAGGRGEVEVRSRTQTPGYWRRPDLTEKAIRGGFFRTGDIGFLDTAGCLNIMGRAAEVFPGRRAHPREVEEAAHAHPAVKECALLEAEGRALLAYSVRRGRELGEAALGSFLAERVAQGEVPGKFERVPGDLPRSAAGKVVRSRVLETVKP